MSRVWAAALHLIPYGLVASASPLGLAATLTVIRAGRFRAVGLAAGAVAGQLLACGLLVLLGTAAAGGHATRRPHVEGALQLALGLGLLVLALVVHLRPEVSEHRESSRGSALLRRLTGVGVLTACVVGVLLGIGGPKRLVLTVVAAGSIASAGVDRRQEAILTLWYGLLATAVVWAPVLGYVVLGNRVVGGVDAGVAWFSRHRRPVTVWSLVTVGGFLTAEALASL